MFFLTNLVCSFGFHSDFWCSNVFINDIFLGSSLVPFFAPSGSLLLLQKRPHPGPFEAT